jgi:hypothetical protein
MSPCLPALACTYLRLPVVACTCLQSPEVACNFLTQAELVDGEFSLHFIFLFPFNTLPFWLLIIFVLN